jgi:hypothetical protein
MLRSDGILRRTVLILIWPVRQIVDYVRIKRRVRALRRRDPFIY